MTGFLLTSAEWYAVAISYGVSSSDFWRLNPKILMMVVDHQEVREHIRMRVLARFASWSIGTQWTNEDIEAPTADDLYPEGSFLSPPADPED